MGASVQVVLSLNGAAKIFDRNLATVIIIIINFKLINVVDSVKVFGKYKLKF